MAQAWATTAAAPRCPDLRSFAAITAERAINGKTTLEHRFDISSLPSDAARLNRAVRAHWGVENRLHWCMDVVFGDDQMRVRTGHATHNFAVLCHFALNLIRLAPMQRKGALKAKRLITSTSDAYRAPYTTGKQKGIVLSCPFAINSGEEFHESRHCRQSFRQDGCRP